MKQELLYEYGLNEQGQIINAKDAQKGKKYICPGCKADLILKKSGNTGPGSRIPHFAHNNLTGSCSYESYLHKTFILKTVEFLQERITNNQPIALHWICSLCKQEHKINLVGFSAVVPEFSLKERKPDIALFDKVGNVCAVIEVIYKHPPEDGALRFYREHNIRVLQINISSDEDLDNVEQKLRNPASFDLCTAPRVHQVPLFVPVIQVPKRRSLNGIPRDLLDNPGKYYSRNGKFHSKRGRGRRSKFS